MIARSPALLLLALALALGAPAAAQPPELSTSAAAAPAPSYSGPALIPAPAGDPASFQESFKGRAMLIAAAKAAIRYLKTLPPNKTLDVAGRRYAPAALIDSARAMIAIARAAKSPDDLDRRVRAAFDVFESAGSDGKGRVVFSSYYEPVLDARLKRTRVYRYPLYRRPPDMVEVDLSAFGVKADSGGVVLGRVGPDRRVTPYYTRSDIDRRRALAGRGLEIAWLKNPLDAMDLQVQGSGILRLRGGREVMVAYAGTNDRPFSSAGMTLVRTGVFRRDQITYAKLRDYLRRNPDAASWILAQNPRYTFFDLSPLPPGGEPYGAAGRPLVAARSIAVDPSVVPLGALVFFTTTSPLADRDGRLLGSFPSARFAFALDTGGAIKGAGRVDIYAGHGPQAVTTARNQWAAGRLYVLVKKLPARAR